MNNETLSTATPISRKKSFNFSSITIILIALILFIFLSFTSDTFLNFKKYLLHIVWCFIPIFCDHWLYLPDDNG